MALESATYINQLIATNPTGGDDRSTADDHLRLLKAVLLTCFPNIGGVITADHEDLSALAGAKNLLASIGELNILNGATLSTAELNTLDGILATVLELNYSQGLTGNIQDQIDALQLGGVFVDAADGGAYVSSVTRGMTYTFPYAWESFGPTGSGADTIWTALNGLPAGTNWIEVALTSSIRGALTASTAYALSIYARKNGSSVATGAAILKSYLRAISTPAGDLFGDSVVSAKIPISAAKMFDIYGEASASSVTATSTMTLVGYGT